MDLDTFLGHFDHVKPSGDGWIARCPGHNDHRPSLSIAIGKTGKRLLKCHRGCPLEDIVTHARLAMHDLAPDTEPGTTRRQGFTIVATYDYGDEAGTLLYQAVRIQSKDTPKDFKQRRPNGHGGWIWNMKTVRRVVYRLPDLVNAKPELVFVVEGEKDADRLWRLELAATTNVGGATKWHHEYATHLRTLGVQAVIVLPDHDALGRKHAAMVAASCHAAGLQVKVVALPDLAEKGDVSDFLDRHELADLHRICREAPVYEPPANAPADDTAKETPPFARHPTRHHIAANNVDNIRLALRQLDVVPAYNDFTRRVEITGVSLNDDELDRIWLAIADTFHFQPSIDVLHRVLKQAAFTRRYHPVLRYLDALQWDGTSRLDNWLTIFGGAASSEYVRAVAPLSLIAAVRRVRRPGIKFDEITVFEAPQGTLKSSALRALCPDETWFSDDLPLGASSKEIIERTTGKWIIECAELIGHRGREAESIKHFLSRQVDGPVRPAYGRIPIELARQFVIIGTTNTSHYLRDPTGGRRFWPVRIEHFDLEALAAARDQLWAEANARERRGDSIRLPSSHWKAAEQEQDARRVDDPWEALLEPLFTGDVFTLETTDTGEPYVRVQDVWQQLGIEAKQSDPRHADRIAAIAQLYGFTKGRPYISVTGRDGQEQKKQQRCWVRTLL
jgi:predicted P-loop ATPase